MTHPYQNQAVHNNSTFILGIVLNVGFVLVEVVFGFLSDSLALLADAGHNAGDVLGLLLALGANLLVQRKPDKSHTYGWRSSTIMAALLNAVILLVAVGGIALEAVRRIGDPQGVSGETVIWVAAVGTVINLVTALLFKNRQARDLNVRGAFIHMAADAGVSAGVVISGLVIRATGAVWLDPVVSLVIAGVILISTWNLLRDSFHLAMGGVPHEIDLAKVRDVLSGLEGVGDVHDLHVWSISTTEVALTAHLVKPVSGNEDDLIEEASRELKKRFHINHITLQWEQQKLPDCQENAEGWEI